MWFCSTFPSLSPASNAPRGRSLACVRTLAFQSKALAPRAPSLAGPTERLSRPTDQTAPLPRG